MFDFILRPLRRNFGDDKRFYVAIDDMFGFIPHNIELYKLALIHKSASVELEDGSHINNERLEFLGDAVIESITSDYLFIEFPDSDEGFMTQLRSKIVSRQSLNRIASEIGLDKHVISNAAGNSTQKHIYGDAFEAMMGAIYLDQGYDFVNRLLINEIFAKHLSIDEVLKSETDFKSRLIEWCQKNRYTIEFRTDTDRSASSARPLFHSVVYVDGIAIGHGHGDSKKAAEQNAAYSVSQTQNTSIDDENSARILDKLDRMSS
jgi:ribonuclease-3